MFSATEPNNHSKTQWKRIILQRAGLADPSSYRCAGLSRKPSLLIPRQILTYVFPWIGSKSWGHLEAGLCLHFVELYNKQVQEMHFWVIHDLQMVEASEISSGQTLILKALCRCVHPPWIMQLKLNKVVVTKRTASHPRLRQDTTSYEFTGNCEPQYAEQDLNLNVQFNAFQILHIASSSKSFPCRSAYPPESYGSSKARLKHLSTWPW